MITLKKYATYIPRVWRNFISNLFKANIIFNSVFNFQNEQTKTGACITVFAVITAPLQLKRHPAQEHNFSSLNLPSTMHLPELF